MKKKLLSVLLAGVMALSLAACGAGGSSEGAASSDALPTAPTEDGSLQGTLKVGLIGPLTGGAALYGNAVDNGAKIAIEEINAEGGAFQMDYKAQDDEHDAEKSVNAYNQLKDWGVQVIVGTVTTTPCIAVSAEANTDRIFMLTPSASAQDVTANKDQTYQLCFSDPNQGSASAQYISENGLATKVAIIYKNDDAYSTGIYQTFKAKADELGLEIVSETTFMDGSDNDFTVQLTDAKDKGADLVFLPMYYTPASLILSQADSMGYAPTFFGVDGMDGILGIEGFDTSLAEGVILLTPFAADATDDLTVNFVTKFQEAYGETPIQFAADGYDCPKVIYVALQKYASENGGLNVDELSASDLCRILISVLSDSSFAVDGVTGQSMQWSANGEVNKAPKGMVIKDGVYVGL
ncbi:MAG: ABC transporter substrate-binding protein [Lachnospiraceae bacterium]|nr:ABC transporter substrate-binding protein [Lachnospiraceae bacterium]